MKPGGVSTLNPYAAAYIPLSKRGAPAVSDDLDNKVEVGRRGGVWYGAGENRQRQQQDNASTHLRSYSGGSAGFYGSSSRSSSDKKQEVVDEELDMALEYLQMAFPGVSIESIADVYLANKGDLEAAIDMLTHLEFDTLESSENLPDTLDIGDVSEPGSTADTSSVKLKNVAGEVGPSSSGSSTSDIVAT